jgi:hypothetical protein
VPTGEPAFEHLYRTPIFDYCAGHPDTDRVVNEAMVGWTNQIGDFVVASWRRRWVVGDEVDRLHDTPTRFEVGATGAQGAVRSAMRTYIESSSVARTCGA